MAAFIDLSGRTFGRLTVIRRAANKGKQTYWLCRCSCSNMTTAQGGNLASGHATSCGCLKNRGTHGMTHTSVYRIWGSMISRCTCSNNVQFSGYGGRGITVHPEWLESFEAFYRDMGDRPDGLTLDRVDNNKGYTPGNCRWATPKEQANNRRNNRNITWRGRTLTLKQWSEELCIPYRLLYARIIEGQWTIEKALTEPVKGT